MYFSLVIYCSREVFHAFLSETISQAFGDTSNGGSLSIPMPNIVHKVDVRNIPVRGSGKSMEKPEQQRVSEEAGATVPCDGDGLLISNRTPLGIGARVVKLKCLDKHLHRYLNLSYGCRVSRSQRSKRLLNLPRLISTKHC